MEIKHKGVLYTTKVHENAGKAPIWNQTYDLHIDSISDDIFFELKDKEVMGSRVIGRAVIKASSFCINGGVKDYFTFINSEG